VDRAVSYTFVEAFLFGTCNLKCGYCWFAESGKVLDASELARFRDQAVIEQIANFFNKRTTEKEKWHLLVTGGEPLLMPNFPTFAKKLFAQGNKISCYTALLIPRNHPSFQCLIEHGASEFGYIMASFHPEAELQEEEYWRKIQLLKDRGHQVIVRFVGHPKRLHLMERLSKTCEELGVCFYPTSLFSKNYPAAYLEQERELLRSHFSSLSQAIQLEGGLDTNETLCSAGSELISIDFTSGDIWPCISTQTPVLGNIYTDQFSPLKAPIVCPKAGEIACFCDIHYQQNIVIGSDDRQCFERAQAGFVKPIPIPEQNQRLKERKLKFTKAPQRIGEVVDDQVLIYPKEIVKRRFEENFGKHLIQLPTSAPATLPAQEAQAQLASLPTTPPSRAGLRAKLMSLFGF